VPHFLFDGFLFLPNGFLFLFDVPLVLPDVALFLPDCFLFLIEVPCFLPDVFLFLFGVPPRGGLSGRVWGALGRGCGGVDLVWGGLNRA